MSLAVEILLCVGYAVIFITNIAGNLLVCAIVFKTKNLQNLTSILIVNMDFGDLTVRVVGVTHIILEDWFLIGGINKYSLLCGRWNVIALFSASAFDKNSWQCYTTFQYLLASMVYCRVIVIVWMDCALRSTAVWSGTIGCRSIECESFHLLVSEWELSTTHKAN